MVESVGVGLAELEGFVKVWDRIVEEGNHDAKTL